MNNSAITALNRPIKTYDEIYYANNLSESWRTNPWEEVLLEPGEFLKLFHRLYRYKVPRRTLQLYSSPQLKLLPLPIYRGGHKSYYLNPEHTIRLAVIMHLREKLFFPLQTVRQVMNSFPAEHYRFILDGTLTGPEILHVGNAEKRGFGLKDVLYKKACDILESINEPINKGMEKYGDEPMTHAERYVNKVLIQEAQELQKWLKTDRRIDMGFMDTDDKTWMTVQQQRKQTDQELKEMRRGRRHQRRKG